MANRVVEQLDELIHQTEIRLERLRLLRDTFDDDPNFLAEFQELLLDPKSNGKIDPVRATSARNLDKSNHERIRDYLLAKENKGLTITEIVAGTGINHNSVRAILYTTHPADFDSSPQPGTRRHLWRLVESKEPVVISQAGPVLRPKPLPA